MKFNTIKLSGHALVRMGQRNIDVDDIRTILETGNIIENYEDDKPFPSQLFFGMIGMRPVHVLAALNHEQQEMIIITVYEPDEARWDEFTRRKKQS